MSWRRRVGGSGCLRFRSRGITLVEVLVVLSIIVIIATVVTLLGTRAMYVAKLTHCKRNLGQIGSLLHVYCQNYGSLPLFYLRYANNYYDADAVSGLYWLGRRFDFGDGTNNQQPISSNWIWIHGGLYNADITTGNVTSVDRSLGFAVGLGLLYYDRIFDYTEHIYNPESKIEASKEYINYIESLFCPSSSTYGPSGTNGNAYFGPYEYGPDSKDADPSNRNPTTGPGKTRAPRARYVETSYIYRGPDSLAFTSIDAYEMAILVADYREKKSGCATGNYNHSPDDVNVLYGNGRVETIHTVRYYVNRGGVQKRVRSFFAEPEDVDNTTAPLTVPGAGADANGVFDNFLELQRAKNLYLAPNITAVSRNGSELTIGGYNFEGHQRSGTSDRPSNAHLVKFKSGASTYEAAGYAKWTDTAIVCTIPGTVSSGSYVWVEIRGRASNTDMTVP